MRNVPAYFGRRILPAALILLAASAAGAPAQERERDDVRLRNDCRLASQVLTTGQPAPLRAWAMTQIVVCDESAGAAVAAAWSAVENDSASLASLRWSTAATRDARVWEATSAAARDAGQPLPVRLTALSLLPTFAVPSIHVDPAMLREPPRLVVLPVRMDYPQVEGTEPLPSDIAQRVLVVLLELASDDTDATMRAAARYLHEGLTLRLEALPVKR